MISRRVSDMSPGDIQRLTQRAALIAQEYERHCGEYLTEDDRQTLLILSVMTLADTTGD
jgi:hypothetical protein